jgi:hypothetical protein
MMPHRRATRCDGQNPDPAENRRQFELFSAIHARIDRVYSAHEPMVEGCESQPEQSWFNRNEGNPHMGVAGQHRMAQWLNSTVLATAGDSE